MRISNELKVALLGIVAIAALYFGFLFLKGSDLFSSTKTYYVNYASVDGLTLSGPVVLNGIKVGVVQDMKLLPEKNNSIQVALEVDENIVVGDSTIASLTSSDLLGGKAITLFMKPNKKIYKGGETLLSFTEVSLTTMLTQKAMPVLGTIDSTLLKLNGFFDEDAKKSIRGTILNTEATTRALQQLLLANQQNINQITTNMAALTGALRQTERRFNVLAGNLNQITDTLKNAPVNDLVRDMNKTVAEAQTAIKSLNNTLTKTDGTLGRIMNDDSLYANLNASSASLDALLKDFKANPKRYVHFSLIGGGTKVENAQNVKAATKVGKANNVEKAGAGAVEEVEKK